MDMQNKDFHKTLEVIWNRNRNSHRSKLFPEMKGINIEDSVKKVKKVSKLDKFKRSIKINENGIDLAHKHVKKRLFQDDKSKTVSDYSFVNKLNNKQSSDNFNEMPEILLKRSPPIISNREKIKRKKSNQRLLQNESTKPAVCSPQHLVNDTSLIKSSCSRNQILPNTSNFLYKSPEIISNRKHQHIDDTLEKINLNELIFSDLSKLSNKPYEIHSHNLTKISQNSLTKTPPIVSSQGILKNNKFKQCLFQTESPKISKTAECSPTYVNSDTSIKSSYIVNQTHLCNSNLLHNKSPEIMSNRKRQYEKDAFLEKMNSNESTFSYKDLLNKKFYETHSHNSTEIRPNSLKKASPILSRKELIKRNKFKQRLFQTESPKISKPVESSPLHLNNDTSVIKSSCILKQIHPSASNLLPNKSPEIVSNRKRQYAKDTFLEKNLNESTFANSDQLNKVLYKTPSHNLSEISQKSPTKNSKTVADSPLHSVDDTSIIKSSCIVNQMHLSTSRLLYNKSPEIMSNRKQQYVKDTFLEKMNLNESEFANSDQFNKKLYKTPSHDLTEISQMSPTKNSKTVADSPLHSVDDTSIIKSSCIVHQMHPSTNNLLYNKSPEIMSNRKQQYVKDTFLEKMNLNESEFANSDQFNKKLYKTPSHDLTEISQMSPTKNSKTVADSPLHSVDDTSIIKSSCIVHQMHPSTNNLLYNKSPEIMSNRKKQRKLLEKMNFSYNTPTMNYSHIPQATKMLNKKSELKNTNRNKVKLKLNFEDSEDIIESSEILTLICKKKCAEDKNRKNKKKKLKSKINGNLSHELKSSTNEKHEISKKNLVIDKKMIKNDLYEDINDSLDIINTETSLMPVEFKVEKKSPRKKSKKFIETLKVDNETFKPLRANEKKDTSISAPHLPSEISLIPATPENMIIVDEPAMECSVETIASSYIPQIEVDKSPKTPFDKNCQVLIQSIFTPPNVDNSKLPVIFESVVSPTQSFLNSELSFKIDSVESPSTAHDNYVCDNFFSPEVTKKKLDKSPSPNCFDSAKKRKKVCKNGLRGKFRELINRKKSEACIREYEKNLSAKYQLKHDETTLLNVIEVWKEFRTSVLLCYYMKSETQVQKVIVTLDNCPKYATKNSVIRIYSPWLTIESKTTEIELFIGVVYAEVIEFSGSNKPLGPPGLNTNISGLCTSLFRSEIKWKCNCSEETACQCLGELSAYNYLQYMISY